MKSDAKRQFGVSLLIGFCGIIAMNSPAHARDQEQSIRCQKISSFPYLTLPAEEELYLDISEKNDQVILEIRSFHSRIGQYFPFVVDREVNWASVQFKYPKTKCDVKWDTNLLFSCDNNDPRVTATFLGASSQPSIIYSPEMQFTTRLMQVALASSSLPSPQTGGISNYLLVLPSGPNISTQLFFDKCKRLSL